MVRPESIAAAVLALDSWSWEVWQHFQQHFPSPYAQFQMQTVRMENGHQHLLPRQEYQAWLSRMIIGYQVLEVLPSLGIQSSGLQTHLVACYSMPGSDPFDGAGSVGREG